jgi:hypothetical protein
LWWSAVLLITLVTCGWVEPMSASPSRRRLLQAALLSPVAAACTTKRDKDDGPVDPDVAIRAAAVAREERLLDLYSAAAPSTPGVAGTLASIRAEHEAHLAALRPRPASPSASTGSPRSLPAVAPRALVHAERAAAAEHAAAALTASRPLAALLASLAGSEASHAVVLT